MITMQKPRIRGGLLFFMIALGGPGCAAESELDSPDTPRSELPADLAREWYTGSLSAIQYYDRDSGEWQDPSGEGFYIIFEEDGSYESGAVINSIVAGCEMRLLGTEVGTATLAGDELTLHRHWVTTSVTNTCGDEGKRTQGEATTRLSWSVDVDETGLEWLSLVHEDGSVERYRPW
jgi:hypothetical protein